MGDISQTTVEVRVSVDGKRAIFSLDYDGEVQSTISNKIAFSTPAYNILWTEVKGKKLELSYLNRDKKGKSELINLHGQLQETDISSAEVWCKKTMEAAYKDIKPQRKLRILINPFGGPGKARQWYVSVVEPLLKAARCTYETTFTERSKHASDIAKNLPLDVGYDALVLLSGDGLIHEVFNGFAEHDDPIRAFAMPIVPIPTGSGNGTALNLLGLAEGFDVGVAALNAVKGKPMKQDICSATIGDKRVFTFMTQTLGLMADLDLGTEHLRWMGDLRFMIGFLRGVMKMKSCPLTLSIKLQESDKDKMLEEFKAKSLAYHQHNLQEHTHEVGEDSLPVLKHTEEPGEEDGWITFDKPIVFLVAGKSPYVGRDLMQFPVAHASDGLIDIVAQETTSRATLLKAIDGAEKGAAYWNDSQHYFKAHAYRVTPLSENGNFAVDGERYPLQTFTVECHRALGTFLSPYGRYSADFDVPNPKGKKNEATPVPIEVEEVISARRARWRRIYQFITFA